MSNLVESLPNHFWPVPEYEVFGSSVHLSRTLDDNRLASSLHRRRKRQATVQEDRTLHIEFDAFDTRFQLKLWPNTRLLAPSFTLTDEMVAKLRTGPLSSPANHSYEPDEPARLDNDSDLLADQDWSHRLTDQIEHCFYQGVIVGREDSTVALSLCNGMVRGPLPSRLTD